MTIGSSYDGARMERPSPTAARVPWAEVRWPVSLRVPAAALRGAIVAALGDDAHVDYHQHADDGSTRPNPPTVCYRVRAGMPSVHVVGPRARDHARELAQLPSLGFPSVGRASLPPPWVQHGATDVRIRKAAWHRYELVSPYFPAEVTWRRRPRRDGPGRWAWAGQALEASLRLLWCQLDLPVRPCRPLHVQVCDLRSVRVRWRGDGRHGFMARFASNAVLPPGVALGAHRSVGFGEVRPWA